MSVSTLLPPFTYIPESQGFLILQGERGIAKLVYYKPVTWTTTEGMSLLAALTLANTTGDFLTSTEVLDGGLHPLSHR